MFAGMWSKVGPSSQVSRCAKATGAMKKEEKVEKTATNASSAWGAETASGPRDTCHDTCHDTCECIVRQ